MNGNQDLVWPIIQAITMSVAYPVSIIVAFKSWLYSMFPVQLLTSSTMELASDQSDLSQLVATSLTNPVMLDTPVINEVKQYWTTTVDGRPLGSCRYCC